jgi:cardiolipin synthase
MWKKQVFTIPNILSGIRILLSFFYLWVYVTGEAGDKRELLAGILIVSAVTDWLDGRIARKFHMVSEVGKILDPIADKLTQGILLICLLLQYHMAKYVLCLFLIKESYMGIMGLKTIRETGKNEGAMWYGKVSTAVFYTVMILLTLFPDIPTGIGECMLTGCGLFMLMAFILYGRRYHELRKTSYL